MEIQNEFVTIFNAVKKSKKKGLRYCEMQRVAFDSRDWHQGMVDYDSRMDRGILTVHHNNFFKHGIVKCTDGRYRCLGYV
jgi:hypothetical protein